MTLFAGVVCVSGAILMIMCLILFVAFLPEGNKRLTWFLMAFMFLFVFVIGFFAGGILS